uniref:winged helix-turn-helix transcriptional regulator n=1 Tax=Nonomuraea bangladeshensis TaxID=404385 RepID=UPI003F4958A6
MGERWSLLIIRHALFRGVTRFGDFQRSLGVARNILAARLDRFVEEGLMERRPVAAARGPYHDYVLTDMGRELLPVVVALTHWGDRWAAPGDPPVVFRHADCGGAVHQQAVCQDCGQPVAIHAVQAHPTAHEPSFRRPT